MFAVKTLRLKALLALMACLLLTPATAPAQGPRGPVLPSERALNAVGLELAWWNQATMDPSRDRIRYFTTDEEISYVQSRSGLVTAFDNSNGRKLWARQLGTPDKASQPAISNEDVVIVAAGVWLHAVERRTGNLAWEIPVPGVPSASPTVDDRQVYQGTLDGTIYAFDLRKLTQYHKEDLLPRWTVKTQTWQYKTGSEITVPSIAKGVVLNVACRDGSLYGLSASERQLRFQFETDAPISAPMAYSGGYLFLASQDFNVYCINADNGVIRWEYVSGLPIYKQAHVIGSQVFLLPENGGLYCLGTEDGREQWWNPNATDFIGASLSLLYASDEQGNVLIIRRDDGATVASLPLRAFDVRVANDKTDRLFLANSSGLVICLREINRRFPIYLQNPERQPVLPELTPEGAPAADAQPKTPPEPGDSGNN